MKNQAKLDYLKKFNVELDEETTQLILDGTITVKDVLDVNGKDCCDWVTIWKPSADSEYTQDEIDFFEKYIHSFLEIGKDRNVVIDYAETEQEITVQVKHRDVWNDFQFDMGLVDNWYMQYLNYNRV